MGALDKRLYTSHHTPTDAVSQLEPDCVKLACPGCWWPSAARLSLLRYCTHTPHPCTVLTTAHNIHTRPPDAPARLVYQRTLMNPYCIPDLRRPRHHKGNQGRLAFPVTRSGTGVDLPGVGRRDMSDQEDTPTAQAARGGSSSRGARARSDDDRGRPWNRRDFIPGDDPGWARCTVKRHEDFPRHIFRLFLLLGIQFRWLLTRGALGSALVTPAEAGIDDAKERAWMDTYETDRDTLEDVLYRRLEWLWAPFTDDLKVFQKHNASQPLCAQKVWEALLTAFPLDHKRMQTALLARELARLMRWDVGTTRAINLHFSSITELHHTLNFICELSMEDVLQSVLLATLRASPNASLRAAYHTVLDALDEEKDLTFALIQDHCAREIRRSTRKPDRRGPARGDDRHFVRPSTGTPSRAAVHRRQDFPRNDPGDISVFLCNILEVNNIKPKRVLKAKNLPTNDMQDAFAIQALFEADAPYMPEKVASDTDASGTDPSSIDSQASDASDD